MLQPELSNQSHQKIEKHDGTLRYAPCALRGLKRCSVGIVAGFLSCFEARKRARRLKQQIVRAGERHISTGIVAKAAAWLQPFMPLVARGFSFCLTPLHTRRGAARRFMFAWAGVFYSCVPLAALSSSAGSCSRSSVAAFSPARQLPFSEQVLSILRALRDGTAALYQTFR